MPSMQQVFGALSVTTRTRFRDATAADTFWEKYLNSKEGKKKGSNVCAIES